ncbi:MAG: methyltransferase [Desulfamplus sp.]|nr:methyltransferase [Desulfamplus sp.]
MQMSATELLMQIPPVIQTTRIMQTPHVMEIPPEIQIDQPKNGYRFSIDPILLISRVIPEKEERILDIGTGCGIMPLLLAFKYPNIHITAVEIQKSLAQFAQKNIVANHFKNRITLINRDIRQISNADTGGRFDRIISNPPYKKKGSGRVNPDIQKAIARHEITLSLNELILCVANFLKPGGILNIVYPADRLIELQNAMLRHSIQLIDMIFVNTKKDKKPKLMLITGCAQQKRNI